MNDERRKRLRALKEQLGPIIDAIQELRDEEDSVFAALPAGLQSGSKGEKMEGAIREMEAAIESLYQVQDALQDAAAK